MAFLDKLKFWKSGDDSLKPLGEGAPEGLGGSEGAGGPDTGSPDAGFQTGTGESGAGGEASAGIGGDATPGLGGTGNIGEPSGGVSHSQQGPGHQQAQQQAPPQQGGGSYSQRYSAEQDDSGIAMSGPSYEKPPESGDLRHAPLSPEGRGRSANEGTGGSGSRDAEIISAKLDAIKANIESMNHRLESIERVVMNQERKRVQW